MIPDERLELIFACCHPALAADAQVALTLSLVGGLDDAGDRAGVHRPRADPRATARAGQAKDPRRRHSAARSAGAPPARAAAHRARRDVSRLQRRLRPARAPRALRRGDPARAAARNADARRAGGARPARARAPSGCAARRARIGGRAPRAARGPGPRAVGRRRDRTGSRRARARARAADARAVPAAGGDRRAPRRGGDGLARRSRSSTAGCSTSCRPPSSSSTAPSRSRWRTGPRKGSP